VWGGDPCGRPGVGLGLARDEPSDPTYRLALLSREDKTVAWWPIIRRTRRIASPYSLAPSYSPSKPSLLSRQGDHHTTPRATVCSPKGKETTTLPRGRPQGSPPLINPTPALTKTTTS